MASVQELLALLVKACAIGSILVATAGCEDKPKVVDTSIEDEEPLRPFAVEEPDKPLDFEDEQTASYDPTPAQMTSAQSRLLEQYSEINSACRGGAGFGAQVRHACGIRDLQWTKLRRSNLCRGKVGDQAEADMEWHVCSTESLDYSSPPPSVPQGTCRIRAEGQVVLDGTCLINLQQGGSFWVLSPDLRVFAEVDRFGAAADSYVSSEDLSFASNGEFGEVTRSGACWSNDSVEICAWG